MTGRLNPNSTFAGFRKTHSCVLIQSAFNKVVQSVRKSEYFNVLLWEAMVKFSWSTNTLA